MEERLMKKIVFSIALLITATLLSAQTILLMDHNYNPVTNGSFSHYGDANTMMEARVFIQNNTSSSVTINVKKIEIDIYPGTTNSFCFKGTCYPNTTFISPTSLTLGAGVLDTTNFYGDYSAYGNVGSTSIMYVFFDVNNPDDSSYVTITYISTLNNISESSVFQNTISPPYPNPSRSYARFSYTLAQNAESGRLLIYDLLGTSIENLELIEREGTVTVQTSSLQNGIYFYSFIVDDKTILTKRMIVKH